MRSTMLFLALVACGSVADEPDLDPDEPTDSGDEPRPEPDACSGESTEPAAPVAFTEQSEVDAFCEGMPDRVDVSRLEVTGAGIESLEPLHCVCVQGVVSVDRASVEDLYGPDLGGTSALRISDAPLLNEIIAPRTSPVLEFLDLRTLPLLERVDLASVEHVGRMEVRGTPDWDLGGLPALRTAPFVTIEGPISTEGWAETGDLRVQALTLQLFDDPDLDHLPCMDVDEVYLEGMPNLRDPTVPCTDEVRVLSLRDLPLLARLDVDGGLTVTEGLYLREVPILLSLGNVELGPELRAVTLWRVPDFDGIEAVLARPGLVDLRVLDTPVALDGVTSWPTLTHLHLRGVDGVDALDDETPELSWVRIEGMASLTDLSGLGAAARLDELVLRELPLTDTLRPLHTLDRVDVLEIEDTPRLTDEEIDAFLAAVSVGEVRVREP